MTLAQVDSPDSLENIESKWVGEITEHCPGVDVVLVALKCDLRPGPDDNMDGEAEPKRSTLSYDQGLEVAKRIHALRYLGMRTQALAALSGYEMMVVIQNFANNIQNVPP